MALQIERQAALRAIERARPAQNDILESRRSPAAQRVLEGLVGTEIDQAEAGLQDAFGVGSRFIRITGFVAVIDFGRCGHEAIVRRSLCA